MNTHPTIPWLCVGDFNEITRQDEKLGGARWSHNQMQFFRDIIDECGFMDLVFIGPKFTWCKHFGNRHSIWERLDRALATNSRFLRYPGTRVLHLPCLSSNYCPLLINPTGIELAPQKKLFRFEDMWLSDSLCGEIIEAAWN